MKIVTALILILTCLACTYSAEEDDYDVFMMLLSAGLTAENEYITPSELRHKQHLEISSIFPLQALDFGVSVSDSEAGEYTSAISFYGVGVADILDDGRRYGTVFLENGNNNLLDFAFFKYFGDTDLKYRLSIGKTFRFPEKKVPGFGFSIGQTIDYSDGYKGARSSVSLFTILGSFVEEKKNNWFWSMGVSWKRDVSSFYGYDTFNKETEFSVQMKLTYSFCYEKK